MIRLLPEVYGDPHRHAGLGMRKLRRNTFEIRLGLQTRVIFQPLPEALLIVFIGNHDQVKRYLKGG